ncbi:hypothetical protein [uncultured Methanobrevibacter sp.]|uniref:hypothetical protein n=1 Tax=uncultured Methanobrevibacter sp. TaxID=253161 RepID=UPI0026037663|nr:hypothetical protein [uncultured Methanobrevibacter sp.]
MIQIIEKVTKELEKLGLTMETVENEHILEACTAKVALVDNLSVAGVDFDELERKVFPDSTFIYQMIQHLDEGGSGNDMISAFLIKAIYNSPELQDILDIH